MKEHRDHKLVLSTEDKRSPEGLQLAPDRSIPGAGQTQTQSGLCPSPSFLPMIAGLMLPRELPVTGDILINSSGGCQPWRD